MFVLFLRNIVFFFELTNSDMVIAYLKVNCSPIETPHMSHVVQLPVVKLWSVMDICRVRLLPSVASSHLKLNKYNYMSYLILGKKSNKFWTYIVVISWDIYVLAKWITFTSNWCIKLSCNWLISLLWRCWEADFSFCSSVVVLTFNNKVYFLQCSNYR